MDDDPTCERDETSNPTNDLFGLRDERFYDWVRSIGGMVLSKILECQSINSATILLNTDDVFGIFSYEISDLEKLRDESCFKLTNGNLIVKPGIQNGLIFVLKVLKQAKQERFRDENNQQTSSETSLIREDSFITSLIEWCATRKSSKSLFAKLVESMISNAKKSKTQRRYDSFIRNFSMCLYIVAGKYAYEFVRLNLGAEILPCLTTITSSISSTAPKIVEGEFRFKEFAQYSNSTNVFFGFASEDCTGVIRKVKYDSSTDSFVGFVPPLADGIPTCTFYQTSSFNQLKLWFHSIEKSPLLNLHMFQHIPALDKTCPLPSFMLSGYGTNSSFTAVDVLRRWVFIFDQCLGAKTRILGFSTDGDNKYMRAMRLATGFFASLPNMQLHERADAFEISPNSDWPWFYLRRKQLFLVFQDPTHIATKWRNRLLSNTAQMVIGKHSVSMDHLKMIYDDDKQNYQSCLQIASTELLDIVREEGAMKATFFYLRMLQLQIMAYQSKDKYKYSFTLPCTCTYTCTCAEDTCTCTFTCSENACTYDSVWC